MVFDEEVQDEKEDETETIFNVPTDNSFAVLAKIEPEESSTEESNCEVCEKRNEKRNNLKIHTNNSHEMPPTEKKSANVQTPSEFLEKETPNQGDSVFVPYRCFYCREMLSNLRDLEKHKCSCQGPKHSCDKIKPFCNESCEPGRFELSSVELLSFKNMLIGAYTSERIPCSICSQDFESESFLQLHILQAHIEPMKP